LRTVETRVILLRSGITDWHEQNKLIGQQDPELSERGRAQVERAAQALAEVQIRELLCSPLQRAIQTAQIIGSRCSISVARDQRLAAHSRGQWEGQSADVLAAEPLYQQFQARPTDIRPPGGEAVEVARRRAVAAVEQALGDAASGDVLVLVTHSTIIRMLLGHYLGAPVRSYMRMRITPGSMSVVAFGDGGQAQVHAVNWSAGLSELVSLRGGL
jgi:broad specificity phosphatase PhoE